MKHYISIFFICLCLLSCNSDTQNNSQAVSMVVPPIDTIGYQYSDAEENNSEETEFDEPIQTDIRYINYQVFFNDYSASGYYSKKDTANFTYITGINGNDYDTILVVKADTFKLEEEVFYDLSNKLIQIAPNDSADHFRIFFSLKENIYEQYDYRKFASLSTEQYEEASAKWGKNEVGWSAYTKYKLIKDSANYFFRFPDIDYQVYENNRKREFHLRDTLVDLSGEADNIATLVYKERACLYMLSHALLRIERYSKNKLIETKYILIEFTFGC